MRWEEENKLPNSTPSQKTSVEVSKLKFYNQMLSQEKNAKMLTRARKIELEEQK